MKILKILLLCLLALLFAFVIDFFLGYSVHPDISYGEKDINTMKIFMPDDASDNCGAVLFIHGGSWSGGSLEEEGIRCRIVANGGYIAATMNYTLRGDENADDYTVDIVLDEIDRAIKRLCTFAEERGITLERIGISGYSAGAHLALLYSYSRGDECPLEIAFVSSMAGPADISPEVWGDRSASVVAGWLSGEEITEEMLWGCEADRLFEEVSPISYVGENTPPTMLIHGERDNVVPIANAENLAEKLKENGIDYDFMRLPSSDHSLLQNPIKHLKYYLLLLDYCDTYFN